MYTRREESVGTVNADPATLFAHLDDQTRLSAHMNKRSWKMGWGKMETVLDAAGGRAPGSHIVLQGRVFGLRLFLDEVVTDREPPLRKFWETTGEQRLLVIGRYRMGFELAPDRGRSTMRVAIEYDIPAKGLAHVLGLMLGNWYARWCTRRMVDDARRAFA